MINLESCKLFSGISKDFLESFLRTNSLHNKKYSAGEMIALEGDPCESIGVILSGVVSIQQMLPSGKIITIDSLRVGDSFGEVVIFSDQRSYPASIEAESETQIVYISRENVLKLCTTSPEFLSRFVSLLSNKILMLNRKVKILSLQSPRLKTISYILQKYQEQGMLQLHFDESRYEMAEQLCLPRPSLSRELIKLKHDGWIDFDGGSIKILNLGKLEEGLCESYEKSRVKISK